MKPLVLVLIKKVAYIMTSSHQFDVLYHSDKSVTNSALHSQEGVLFLDMCIYIGLGQCL